MSKLDELNKLKEQFDIKINGIENCSKNKHNIFIANHNCLMDIFVLPMSIPYDIVSLVSSRLIYKKNVERQEMVEKYLYAMPIEAHGGRIYSNLCLSNGVNILKNGYSLGIFPEGAYVEDEFIYRGRTGASRILYNSRKYGIEANLIPVAINIDKSNIDLDSYSLQGNSIEVNILEPIDYEENYEWFTYSDDIQEKNMMLHEPIDKGMKQIAEVLGKTYKNEYIELFPKKSIVLENGNIIPVDEAQNNFYISTYATNLEERKNKMLRKLKNI